MNAFQKIVVIVVFTLVFVPVGGCTTVEREHVDWLEKWSSVKKHRDFPVPALAKPGPVEPATDDFPPAEEVVPVQATPVKADPIEATSIEAAPVEDEPVETALATPAPIESAPIEPAPVERKDINVEADIKTSTEADEGVRDDSLGILADAFLTFRNKIAQAMRFPLENPADIRRILSHLQVENEKQLIQSWFAYNASVVVETPAYVKGINSLLREHTAENLLQRLQTERRFARQVSGAEDVLQRLRREMRNDSLQLQILSQALLDVSDEWKHQKWGALEEDEDGDVVMHALTHLRMFIAVAEKHVGTLRFIRDAHAEAYTPTDLILTLGARRILGARTNEISAIEHPKAFQCFRWARLNLDQCMVSSYNPSEEAWCAGVHGVEDIAGCWQFLLPDENP